MHFRFVASDFTVVLLSCSHQLTRVALHQAGNRCENTALVVLGFSSRSKLTENICVPTKEVSESQSVFISLSGFLDSVTFLSRSSEALMLGFLS